MRIIPNDKENIKKKKKKPNMRKILNQKENTKKYIRGKP